MSENRNNLSQRQIALLKHFDTVSFKKCPPLTKAASILSLMRRGYVEEKMVLRYVPNQTYRNLYEFRLTALGDSIVNDLEA